LFEVVVHFAENVSSHLEEFLARRFQECFSHEGGESRDIRSTCQWDFADKLQESMAAGRVHPAERKAVDTVPTRSLLLRHPAMKAKYRPHVLGIDDGPFEKGFSATTPIVGVMMEGAALVEAVAVTEFLIDGEEATDFIGDWIERMRFAPALQGVIFGGVTIAGLGVIDIEALAVRLRTPVIVVNRKDRTHHRLEHAFAAAGLSARLAVIERMPPVFRVSDGLHAAAAGIEVAPARRLLQATLAKSDLPEPLRVAHLMARAIVRGESRGRP
jgi:endonuclease V-like protein UPF0215 family